MSENSASARSAAGAPSWRSSVATAVLRGSPIGAAALVALSIVTAAAAGVALDVAIRHLSGPDPLPRLNNFVIYREVQPHLGVGKITSGKLFTFGITSTALWLAIGWLAHRLHHRPFRATLGDFPYYFVPLLPLLDLRPGWLASRGVGYNFFAWGLVIASALSFTAIMHYLDVPRRMTAHPRALARASVGVLGVAMAGYAALFGTLSILKFKSGGNFTFDLAQFDQLLWNTAHGRPLESSFLHHNYLLDHFSPILIPLAGLYYVWSDVRCLLVFQSVFIALGALPLYWLATEKIRDPLARLAIPLAYLLYVPLHGVDLEDFHEISLAPTLLIFAWYALERGRTGAGLAWLALAAATKEEVLLIAACLGAYLLVGTRRRTLGLGILTGSLVTFVGYMVLRSSRYAFPLGRYFPFDAPLLAVATPFLQLKLLMLLFLFAPVAGLPFLAGAGMGIMAVPLAAMLASGFMYMMVPTTHYSASLIPLVFVLTVEGLARVEARGASRPDGGWGAGLPGLCAIYMMACSLLAVYVFGQTPWSHVFPRETYQSARHQAVAAFKERIPRTASLSVNNWLAAHFSQRQRLYSLSYGDIGDAEYLLVDLRKHKLLEQETVTHLLRAGTFGVVACQDDIVLLRRGDASDAPCLDSVHVAFRVRKAPEHRVAAIEPTTPPEPEPHR